MFSYLLSSLRRPWRGTVDTVTASLGTSASAPFPIPIPAPTKTKTRRYGWRPDVPDYRDWIHPVRPLRLTGDPLPLTVNWRDRMPPVYDQGHLGSCTANAIAAAVAYDERRQQIAPAEEIDCPSRLFIYWNERALEGTQSQDSGASIRDSVKVVRKWGYCRETTWPYDITQFTVKPPDAAFTEAAHHKAVEYKRVPADLNTLMELLADGNVIVIGISVYDSFEAADVARTGDIPLPQPHESLLGGHAIVLVGYDTDRRRFHWRNSWGPGWGNGGYGTLPFEYVIQKQLASDLWTVTRVDVNATMQGAPADPTTVPTVTDVPRVPTCTPVLLP